MSPPWNTNKLLIGCLFLLVLLGLAVMRSSDVAAYGLMQAPSEAKDVPLVRVLEPAIVRSGPGERYLALAAAEPGEAFFLLGKSPNERWWRINLDGRPAWVAAVLVEAQFASSVATVPVGAAY